ncbi:hypothetical protein KC887_01400 [Candidatus Kaiserbacteria bacterium]|nr:hypothetical protein [Candidatus Kaiserbacteria bacterium]
MTTTITALQNEIAAAQAKRKALASNGRLFDRHEYARLGGYIQGLNQALYLLTKDVERELDF